MTDKVAPVAIAMKPLNRDIVVEENLRCKKCQLVVPCSCTSNNVMLSEIQILEFELNEKQEIAAETVRGMASKRKSSASAPDSSSETTFTPSKPDQLKTFEKIMTDAGKIASSDFNSRWRSKSKGLFQASADNKLALNLYGNKAAVIMEQRRQSQKGEGVIHPFSTFRWYWDIVMVVLITTHVLLLPVGIAFVETDFSASWLTFNCISDAIFIVDIFLSFRTGIIDFNRQEEVILDKQYIRRRYLRGWFVIDVLSSLPFDYVYLIASSGSRGNEHSEIVQASRVLRILKLTKLLSLLKLLRVSRIVRYIKELEELLNIQSGQMRIIKLIGCMLLLSHWNGCVQFLIPRLQDFPDDSWVTINGLKDKPSFEKYSWSLFNAISHMLCIGYGRFPPHSVTELWVTLCSMTFGATFYAVFIGMMSTLIMSIDSSGRLYKEKLNQVGEYMRYRKIPLQLRRRIQDYYEHRYHHKLFDEDAILTELSFPLREEIQIHNARSLLTSVPFFSDAGEDFFARAVSILKFEVFLPGEFICKRGRQADKMYFIVRGIVDVLTTDGFVATSLTDGSHFGEISLLRKGDNRRVASCRAATMLDLYSLTAIHFSTLLKEFPEIHAALEEVAAERLSRLEKYSDEARMHQIKRNYKTEQVTSIDSDETERSKKRLGALKIPTLTKGFLGSLTPTLVASLESGTEKKNEDITTQRRTVLHNIEEEGQGSSNEEDTNDRESESNIDIEIKNTLADF